jgi:ankyrin repeat protein
MQRFLRLSLISLLSAVFITSCRNGQSHSTLRTEHGKSAFFEAALEGDLSQVKRLLHEGVPVNERNSEGGKTALHYAAQAKNIELVRFLIRQGADVNAKSNGSVTPLMLSVDMAFGQPDIALELIKAGADVSAADWNGDTALIIATTESSIDVVQALLEKGANPNARGLGGETALHYAAMNALIEQAKLLIRYGADPSIRNDGDRTAVDEAQSTNPEASVRERFAQTRTILLAASRQKMN